MRRISAALLISLLAPAAVCAQAPARAYMGIYTDEAHTTWCAGGDAPYSIDIWVWLLAGEEGSLGYRFDLSMPGNAETADLLLNAVEQPTMCLPPACPAGIWGEFAFCYSEPRFPSTWVLQATLSVLDDGPAMVTLAPHPEHGAVEVMRCDRSWECPVILTNLYLNYDPTSPECAGLGVEGSTWGSIKRMLR